MLFTSSDVSVIVPSYNSIKTIRKCIDSLQEQVEPPLEIIVVDSSTDTTPKVIEEEYPEVRLFHIGHKLFPGPARNIGAKNAYGAILALIDSDCIAQPTWISQIVFRHSEGYQAVGGSIEVGDPTNIFAWAGHMLEFREFLPKGLTRLTGHIPSCNMSYRADLFLSQGGFPESYYPQEDLLFDYLLGHLGISVLFDPDIKIFHFCRDTLTGLLSHQHTIGRVTRCVLQKLNVKGSVFGRNKWFAYGISPFLGVVKCIRTLIAFVANFPDIALHNLSIIPMIILGAVWWFRGFGAGAMTGLSGIKGWDDPNEPIFSKIVLAEEQRRVASKL